MRPTNGCCSNSPSSSCAAVASGVILGRSVPTGLQQTLEFQAVPHQKTRDQSQLRRACTEGPE